MRAGYSKIWHCAFAAATAYSGHGTDAAAHLQEEQLNALSVVRKSIPLIRRLDQAAHPIHGNVRLQLPDALVVLLAAFFNPIAGSLRMPQPHPPRSRPGQRPPANPLAQRMPHRIQLPIIAQAKATTMFVDKGPRKSALNPAGPGAVRPEVDIMSAERDDGLAAG
jgi:hypothetical protein